MTEREALKQALEALEFIPKSGSMLGAQAEAKRLEAITAIKEALAQPEQEPVAIPDCGEAGHADGACGNRECLPSFNRNTTPPQRTWVGLTDEEKASFWTADQMTQEEWQQLFAAIETKLKEKNT